MKNENKMTAIIQRPINDDFFCNYLPGSIIVYSCYEETDNLINFPNKFEKLDLTYNTTLKHVQIPYNIKKLYTINKKYSICYSGLNNRIASRIMNHLRASKQ